MKKLFHRFKSFRDDQNGSESLEFLSTFVLLLLVVVSLISVLAYAYRVNELNYVARRAVRSIEVSGIYNQTNTEALVHNMLPTTQGLEVNVRKGDTVLSGDNNVIQLRETFSVTIKGYYTMQFFSAFDSSYIRIPIAASVIGMSEVFNKDVLIGG